MEVIAILTYSANRCHKDALRQQ